MRSVVEKTGEGEKGGIWEVKWTWVPAFLAMDQELVVLVDKRLNELFAGGDPPMPGVLDSAMMTVICKKYPMTGLREALEAIRQVDPTVKLHLVDQVEVTDSSEVSLTRDTEESVPASPNSDELPKSEREDGS